jgi:PBP1b-binding outer membrane lipoprotein LpoB
MIAGVQNFTTDHIDTKNITDRLRTLLFKSGQVRFVNEDRRADLLQEQGYQAANVEPDQQVAIGRQLGAGYMFSGAFAEIKRKSPRQVRISRQETRYYKFTLEVTDLETGEIAWINDKEFAREASEPLIRW